MFTLFDPTGLFRGDSAAYAGAAVLLALGLGCVVYLLYHFWGGGQE